MWALDNRTAYQAARGWYVDNVTAGAARPFVTMPVVYERAFGGVDNGDAEPEHQRLDPRDGLRAARSGERTTVRPSQPDGDSI